MQFDKEVIFLLSRVLPEQILIDKLYSLCRKIDNLRR